MKKILLLTVFAFGLADFMVMEDCYAAVESSTGTTKLSKSQKKRLRKKASAARRAQAASGSIAAAEGTTAIVPVATPSAPSRNLERSPVLAVQDAEPQLALARVADGTSDAIIPTTGKSVPTFDSSLTEPQALENLTAAYRRISEDKRSDAATVRTLAEKYAKITSFSESFKTKLQAIISAANANNLAELGKLLGTGSVVSSEGSTLAIKDIDPKTQKAWDKNVTAVKGTLDTLKGAVNQLYKSAEAYKSTSPDDQIKEQNAIEGSISSILKSIESIQGSIDSLGRFKSNDSIQKYLAAFVKDLTAKTKDAFLSTSRRGAQVDPTKVTVTTGNIGAIKATLEPLNQFLLQHRKFLGSLKVAKKDALGATYTFSPSVSKGEVTVEDPFKPTVDQAMFEGKKDKDIIVMLAAYQEEVQELIKKLQDFTAGESEKTKDQENVKQAKALTYKATRDDQLKKAMALKVENRKYTMASTTQQKEMITGVKNSIVVIETYRQELEHMLKVLQDAQAKSAGSVQAKADYDLIVSFHKELDRVLGAMVSNVGNAQQLKPIFQQWMPKKQDTLGILKLGASAKQAKLEEIRGWLRTLETVTV